MPLKEEYALVKLDIQIGDRKIEGKIMAKEKAKEKYDDALAAGHTSALGSENNKAQISLNLGNLLP